MSKNCMVFETLGSITEMKQQKTQKPNEIRLSGVFGVCGVKNNNRRIYSKQNYGQMVECLQKEIMEGGVLGELEHPESMNINLNNVSHKIESVEMNEDGTVTGTILLLNTDKGRNAQAIVEAGVPLYISSRALGNIDASGNVTLTTLKTYDLVGTPGFSQAKLEALKESGQTFEALNESCYVIYEKEDDLLGGSDDKDEKDKKEKEKTDNKGNDEKDSNNITINVNDKAESENEDKKDKKENKDNNTSMEDLNNKVQTLIDKIEKLEASLHVAKESLEKKTEEVKLLEKQLKPNYDAIEKWVKEEFSPRFKSELITQISEGTERYVNDAIKENNNHIEEWTTKEFAPMVEGWVTKEFAPMVEGWVTKEFAPMVEGWVTKEFAPMVEGWTTQEFAPMIEGWVSKEFAPMVEGWITDEFAPIVEKWTIEHYGQKLDEWMEKEFRPSILENVNENVTEFFDNHLNQLSENRFNEIDKMLEAIDAGTSAGNTVQSILENNKQDKYAQFYAIANMPNEYRPLWEMLTESRKDEIAMMSRAYNYTKEGALEQFWAGVDFKGNTTVVKENQVQPQMTFANQIANQMMRMRHGDYIDYSIKSI